MSLEWEKYRHTPHLAVDSGYLLGAVDNAEGFHWWITNEAHEFVAQGGTVPTLEQAQQEAEAALARLKVEPGDRRNVPRSDR